MLSSWDADQEVAWAPDAKHISKPLKLPKVHRRCLPRLQTGDCALRHSSQPGKSVLAQPSSFAVVPKSKNDGGHLTSAYPQGDNSSRVALPSYPPMDRLTLELF